MKFSTMLGLCVIALLPIVATGGDSVVTKEAQQQVATQVERHWRGSVEWNDNKTSLRAILIDRPILSFTDRDMQSLRICDNLSRLSLKETGISSSSLETIDKDFPSLTYLDLTNTHIDDKATVPISNCRNIKHLVLAQTRITDVSTQRLSRMHLQYLDLSYTSVTTKGLEHFKNHRQLRALLLRHGDICDTGVMCLSTCPNLELLDLSDVKVTDRCLVPFQKHRLLSHFWLRSTNITDTGCRFLAKMQAITHLNLSATTISDKGLLHFENHPTLVALYLANTNITDAGVRNLGRLPKLELLDLDNTNITSNSVKQQQQSCPNLRVLNLRRTNIDKSIIPFISKMDTLRTVILSQTTIGSKDQMQLARMRQNLTINPRTYSTRSTK